VIVGENDREIALEVLYEERAERLPEMGRLVARRDDRDHRGPRPGRRRGVSSSILGRARQKPSRPNSRCSQIASATVAKVEPVHGRLIFGLFDPSNRAGYPAGRRLGAP
jgi:hypothetical protein